MTQGQDPGGEVRRGKDDPGKGLHIHKLHCQATKKTGFLWSSSKNTYCVCLKVLSYSNITLHNTS